MIQLTDSAWNVIERNVDESRPELHALLEQLRTIDPGLLLELEPAINAWANDLMQQAFAVGFQAATDPRPYIFQEVERRDKIE